MNWQISKNMHSAKKQNQKGELFIHLDLTLNNPVVL